MGFNRENSVGFAGSLTIPRAGSDAIALGMAPVDTLKAPRGPQRRDTKRRTVPKFADQPHPPTDTLLTTGSKLTLPLTEPFQVFGNKFIPGLNVMRPDTNTAHPLWTEPAPTSPEPLVFDLDALFSSPGLVPQIEDETPLGPNQMRVGPLVLTYLQTAVPNEEKPHDHVPARSRRRKRRGLAALVGAGVLTTAACSVSAPEQPAAVAGSPAMNTGLKPGLVVNLDEMKTSFAGAIPAPVVADEASVVAVKNYGEGNGIYPTEGTGVIAEYEGERFVLTVGHAINGVKENSQIIPGFCDNASVTNAPSTSAYGATHKISYASSEYNPRVSDSPDLATLTPSPTGVPPVPFGGTPRVGENLYIESLQGLYKGDGVLDPAQGDAPSIIEIVPLGLVPGTEDQYIALAGLGGSRKGVTTVVPGASGSPVVNSLGQNMGEAIAGGDPYYITDGHPSQKLLQALHYYGVSKINVAAHTNTILSFVVIQANDKNVMHSLLQNQSSQQSQCLS